MDDTTRAELAAAGLYLTEFDSGVLNIDPRTREITAEDVELFRAALAREGYTETESWVAWQGVSWMSDGMCAGVSFRVQKTEQEY